MVYIHYRLEFLGHQGLERVSLGLDVCLEFSSLAECFVAANS